MTRNKAWQNALSRDPANVPIHEATPVVRDGPEGYFLRRSMRQAEGDKDIAPYVRSSNVSLKSNLKTFREHDTVQGKVGSGRRTFPESPGEIKKNLDLRSSRFGSPFAYLTCQNKHDFFKGLLAEGTRALFDQVLAEASTLRERILTGVALTSDGSNGHFCILKNHLKESVSSEESNSDSSELALHCHEPCDDALKLPLGNLVDFISSSDSSFKADENSKPDKTIDIRRSWNSGAGEFEYFVIHKKMGYLSINGVVVGPSVVAGPLPDFAVLELERFSIFWWRTAAALDYMPNTKRKCRSEYNDEEASRKALKSDTDHSLNPQVLPDSKNWLHEYQRRLKLCDQRPIKYTSLITKRHPPHECSVKELLDTDVILAIGAVWLSLIHGKADFAYANSDLFSFARSMRMVGMRAVKGTNHFLMPLLFNEKSQDLAPESEEDTAEPLQPVFSVFQRREEEENQENNPAAKKGKQRDPGYQNKPPLSVEGQEIQDQKHKGGIGHFVLAIAEKVNRDGPKIINDVLKKKAPVRLRFMDSANGKVDKGMIRRVARNTVRNSGWLGDIWPCFDPNEEYWTEVLRQSGNRCGEHTVLNAWAYMLEIPLATTRGRALGPTSYKEVRKMISLAFRGQLDSMTIRAWMQHSKYAVDEPLSQLQHNQTASPDSLNKLRNVQTEALNETAFNEIVNNIYTQEQATNQGHATIWGAVSVPPDGALYPRKAHEITIGATSPPSGQDLNAMSSSTLGIPASPVSPDISYPSPRTWNQSLARGLARHIALRAENPRTTKRARKEATIIKSSSNMADYEVMLGIAPIWEGLKRLGRAEVDFTYAGMDVFSPGGGQQGVGAVGGWSRFIMPLFLSRTEAEALENQGKGRKRIDAVGHLVLCVAELVNERPFTVQLEIFDSCPNCVTTVGILQEAKKVIDRSGWLGEIDSRTPIVYKPPISRQVPIQVGDNTCGLHVILNAWATMLGIPIYPFPLRSGRSRGSENDATDEGFLKRGLEIINLALEGFMDSATIQAFFNVYGYSAERFGDPARSVIAVNAVGMNQDKLRHTLQERLWSKNLELARAEHMEVSEADIARLRDNGLTEDQAWTAMAASRGPWEKAVDWHYAQDPVGEIAAPADALSPKTPDRWSMRL